MKSEALAALRALRDCGTLLVLDEHLGLLRLYGAGLATVAPYKRAGNDAVIYRLNRRGRAVAAELLR